MPSTFTSSLSLEKIATGEAENTWGTLLNAVLDDLDDAIAALLTKSVAGASDVTLTAAEALHSTLKLTGALTGNINVVVPASERAYRVWNATSGSFTLTVKTSAGTGVLVPQGAKALLVCDGTNVVSWIGALLGGALYLDADNDSGVIADTDDRIDLFLKSVDLFRFDGTTTTPVNGLDFVAADAGSAPKIKAQGSDSDIDVQVIAKGTGDVLFFADALELLKIVQVASAVNFPQIEPSAASNPVKFSAFGDDTNVGIQLQPKGSGATILASGAFNEVKGADIASATTTNIGAATGTFVDITGTTTITGLGTVQAGTRRICQFDGALTLTHNASSLILPTGANITTAAGDVAIFVSLGSGNWICTSYLRASGRPLRAASRTKSGAIDLTSGSPTAVTLASSLSAINNVEIHIEGFSTNAANQSGMIQLGDSGGFHTSGYSGGANTVGTGNSSNSAGFFTTAEAAQDAATVGQFKIRLEHLGSNIWSFRSTGHSGVSGEVSLGHGLVTLDTELTQIQITTSGGSAQIDGGTAYVNTW